MQRFELALGAPRDAFEVLDDLIGEEPLGAPIAKGLDHADSYTVYRYTVNIDPSSGGCNRWLARSVGAIPG